MKTLTLEEARFAPALEEELEATASTRFSESAQQFWANNAVKGKKGFQPTNRGDDAGGDFDSVNLPPGCEFVMANYEAVEYIKVPGGGVRAVPTRGVDIDGDLVTTAGQLGIRRRALLDQTAVALKGKLAKAELVIRSHHAEQIIADGRFKSQFETKTSGGMMFPLVRGKLEQAQFGFKPGTPVEQRPIYGYLRSSAASESGLATGTYGRVAFVLKDSVRPRTTWSGVDTLEGRVAPSPINRPSARSVVHSSGDPRTYEPTQPRSSFYSEIQVHGGVKLSDVKRIEFSPNTSQQQDQVMGGPGIRSALGKVGWKETAPGTWEPPGPSGVPVSQRYTERFDDELEWIPGDPPKIMESMSLVLRHSAAEDYLRKHLPTLITRVTTETREAVRDTILSSFQNGIPPRDAARFIRSMIGLTEPQAATRNRLFNNLINQANRANRGSTRPGSMVVAMNRISKQLDRYNQKAIRYRALNIARTETLRAANAGQQALWQAATNEGLLQRDVTRREWIATPSERTCPYCMRMDGKTVGLLEAWRTDLGDVTSPPLHPSCRCAMGIVINPDAKALPAPDPTKPLTPEEHLKRLQLWNDPDYIAARAQMAEAKAAYLAWKAPGPREERANATRMVNRATDAMEHAETRARDRIREELDRLTTEQARPLMKLVNAELEALKLEANDTWDQRTDSDYFLRKRIAEDLRPELAKFLPLHEGILPRPRQIVSISSMHVLDEMKIYDEFLAINEAIEQEFGLRSRWSGAVAVDPNMPPHAAASFGWDNKVNVAPRTLTIGKSGYLKTLTHEAFHSSQPLTIGQYVPTPGWEEGVVEMATQTFGRRIRTLAGLLPDEGYDTYRKYTVPLETLRESIGKTREEFYGRLIRVPMPQRGALVEDMIEEIEVTHRDTVRGINVEQRKRTARQELYWVEQAMAMPSQ